MPFALVLIFLACLLETTAVFAAQEIVSLPTRDGVTQSFLLVTPDQTEPAAIAVLFPGSAGNLRLRSESGEIKFAQGNFLVRARWNFVEGGIAVAIVDMPSDQPQGMDDRFRLGEKHAADIGALVAALKKRFNNAPVFLVGTSRGSVSAAATGAALGAAVNGVALTSTVYVAARSGPGLSGFDYTKLTVPVLIVHHVDDACRYTPYSEARRLAESRRYAFISVKGGLPPTSDACEAFSSHGFLGKEPETAGEIVKWLLKKPYRENID